MRRRQIRRVVFLVIFIPQLLAKESYNLLTRYMRNYIKNSQTTYVTFMAQLKRDQKIIIFSHSLALTLFQPRGPLGVFLRMGGTYQLFKIEPL